MEKVLEKRKVSDLYLFSYQTEEPSLKPVVLFNIYFLSFFGGFIHFWKMGNISTFPYYFFDQLFSLYFWAKNLIDLQWRAVALQPVLHTFFINLLIFF
jgi:hypothetical protein